MGCFVTILRYNDTELYHFAYSCQDIQEHYGNTAVANAHAPYVERPSAAIVYLQWKSLCLLWVMSLSVETR